MGHPAAIRPRLSRQWGRACIELSKAHLSAYIALSAVAGHVLAQDHLSRESLGIGGWVFLLAAGSAVLNNIQDRNWDKAFFRTQNRVLPREAFPLEGAWIISLVLIGAAGTGLYFSYPSILPFLLGMGAVVCYNLLYTPMKKKSLWAMAPGTACGMIPPAIGWSAVSVYSSEATGLMVLMVCLGIWQFPHYLLVELKQGASGGFQRVWPGKEFQYQVLIWTALFCLGLALFLLQGWVVTPWLLVPAFALAVFLAPILALILLYPGAWGQGVRAQMGFLAINISILLFLALIILDRLVFL